LDEEYRESISRRPSSIVNPIDQRINDLTRRFTGYQFQLQSKINNISNEFRDDVLTNILYSEAFDKSPKASVLDANLSEVKEGLLKTYLDLGLLNDFISKRIDEHIKEIQKSINTIKKVGEREDTNLTINDVLPLSLLSRTQHIVEASTSAEMQKSTILKPVNDYLKILVNYIKDKTFLLDPKFSGEIIIKKGERLLSFEQLSSGEKQLFILLTESLLQRNQPYIFIADEPELSLHIEWQRNVISDIKSLNPEAQIIVATHSPEIAGKWRNNIINMKDIIYD
jgi:predicted ATP-dependent endonuclease of OLD family